MSVCARVGVRVYRSVVVRRRHFQLIIHFLIDLFLLKMTTARAGELDFLSENAMQICHQIIDHIPTLWTMFHLKNKQHHMWTVENGGKFMVDKISQIVFEYICNLMMQIVGELDALSVKDLEHLFDFMYEKCEQFPKCSQNFLQTLYARSKESIQFQAQIPRHENSQRNEMPVLIGQNQCSVEMNNYQPSTMPSNQLFIPTTIVRKVSTYSVNNAFNSAFNIVTSPMNSNLRPMLSIVGQLNSNDNNTVVYQPTIVQSTQYQSVPTMDMQPQSFQLQYGISPTANNWPMPPAPPPPPPVQANSARNGKESGERGEKTAPPVNSDAGPPKAKRKRSKITYAPHVISAVIDLCEDGPDVNANTQKPVRQQNVSNPP